MCVCVCVCVCVFTYVCLFLPLLPFFIFSLSFYLSSFSIARKITAYLSSFALRIRFLSLSFSDLEYIIFTCNYLLIK